MSSRKLHAFVIALLAVPAFAGNEKDYTYLALGESISYGLNPNLLPALNQPLPDPSQFVGYPELAIRVIQLFKPEKLVNASCPGETSASFWVPGAEDYGCHSKGPDGEPPFKTWIGLHTDYDGTQLEFAVSELSSNKRINLVTLSIGGNDILMLLRDCATDPNVPACVNTKLPMVLSSFGENLAQILVSLRANYDGTLVLMTYYSPTPDLDPVAVALNSVITQVGAPFGVKFADGFAAFKLASKPFGGDPCRAGLLVKLSSGVCDVHPSLAGQALLTSAVLSAIADERWKQ